MPQLAKGGKFIFGWSIIRTDGFVQIPIIAVKEYHIAEETKLYLFSSSKTTGGFCITSKNLLFPSKIGNILKDNPELLNYTLNEGEFIQYKGKVFCWVRLLSTGRIQLNILKTFNLNINMKLLCIRSSDIAFTLGAKGPLLEKANNFDGFIEEF